MIDQQSVSLVQLMEGALVRRMARRGRVGLVAVALLLIGVVATQAQEAVPVPSGQTVVLNEVLVDETPGETWVRFRFLAPQISADNGDVSYDLASADMDHLCENLVLPYLSEYALKPARVIISLSDQDVPFGASIPEATQFFEAYRPENADCIWEDF